MLTRCGKELRQLHNSILGRLCWRIGLGRGRRLDDGRSALGAFVTGGMDGEVVATFAAAAGFDPAGDFTTAQVATEVNDWKNKKKWNWKPGGHYNAIQVARRRLFASIGLRKCRQLKAPAIKKNITESKLPHCRCFRPRDKKLIVRIVVKIFRGFIVYVAITKFKKPTT